ncbi:MAG: hypothetical protein LBI02_05955 [Opitutaceae bacterium]|jgi:hypothetical protein|nr:hypothetical protein [Opitutaceae bacterium]
MFLSKITAWFSRPPGPQSPVLLLALHRIDRMFVDASNRIIKRMVGLRLAVGFQVNVEAEARRMWFVFELEKYGFGLAQLRFGQKRGGHAQVRADLRLLELQSAAPACSCRQFPAHIMISEIFSDFGQPIHSYTRKQAIADGVLIDLSGKEIVRRHWKPPWPAPVRCGAPSKTPSASVIATSTASCMTSACFAKWRIRGGKISDADTVRFTAIIGKRTCALKLHLGPGDNHEPVLTLMLADED